MKNTKSLIAGLVVVSCLCGAQYGFAQSSAGFRPGVEIPAGPGPVHVAVRDLNHDGNLDVVMSNFYPNTTATVLLGNGDGTFQPHVEYEVGYVPYGVEVADLNEDTHPDLIVTNRDSNQVAVLLGIGDGTFGPRTGFQTGAAPVSVIAGDLNGDGHVDLATSNLLSPSVAVLVGNGDGTMQPPVEYATDAFPYEVTQGDFNGDGKADLATANYLGNSVSILLGNGDATFQPQVSYASSAGPASIVAGDATGDGLSDLAVVETALNAVSIYAGNGDGTFQAPVFHPVGSNSGFMNAADLDGDSVLDLAVPNYDDHSVSVLTGAGGGSFSAATYGAGAGAIAVGIGDVNGDTAPDLVIVNAGANSITLLLAKLTQTIDIDALADKTFGDEPFAVNAIATSGLPVTLSAAPPSVCTIDGSLLTIQGAGSCVVGASQGGDEVYRPAPDVSRRFVIAKAVASITVSGLSHTYDGDRHGADVTTTPAAVGTLDVTYDGLAEPPFNTGNYSVVARLISDNYEAADVTATLVIGPAAITVTANNVSKPYGAALPTLTATLTGFVNGEDAGIVSGQAACSTTATNASPAGVYPIVCTQGTLAALNYSFNFTAGELAVVPATSATVVVSNRNPATLGQSVRFTATVTSGGGIPNGNMAFYDGPTLLGTDALNSGGVAVLTVPNLAGGTRIISAVYTGSTNFESSTSPDLVQTVLWTTSTVLTSSSNPSVLGQPVTFSAVVTSPGGTPDGSVTFKSGSSTLATVAMTNGRAEVTVSTLSTASHNIKALYSGGPGFDPSNSVALSQVVNKAPTAAALSSSANSTVTGEAVALTASVTASAPGTGVPTGTVTFLDATTATTLGTKTLSGGVAVLSISTLTVGAHDIVATYNGSGNFLSSSSPVLVQSVHLAQTTTALVSSRNPANPGQIVKLTATVSANPPGAGKPTGQVRFLEGAAVLATIPLNNGKAIFSTSTLTSGTHAIIAVYDASTEYDQSASDPLVQQVN